MDRILVIRGGAVGDFVLTLPAINLLRERFPRGHLEILGYRHIIALAEKRFYADATRSIEHGLLAAFFAKDSELSPELMDYFRGFDLIVSYLFDPDEVFAANVKRCGVKTFIAAFRKWGSNEHAARQLARPLEQIGLHLHDCAAKIYPAAGDREFARGFFGGNSTDAIALHPGSGSEAKNWPIENWKELGQRLFAATRNIVVVAGEADKERIQFLEAAWKGNNIRFARDLPLPQLAALLENAVFVGHDSGISHIAAAVGARSILLFGPTDPAIWAPANRNGNVTVLRAPDGNLRSLSVNEVFQKIAG